MTERENILIIGHPMENVLIDTKIVILILNKKIVYVGVTALISTACRKKTEIKSYKLS